MIGISAWDYVYIRTCIFLLHLIAPLGVIYSLVSCLIHPPFHVPHVLEVWLNLEAVFYLLVYLPRKNYLQTVVTHPPPAVTIAGGCSGAATATFQIRTGT